MEKLKYLIITILGVIAAYLKAYVPLIVIVSIAVVFDFITGIVAAMYTGVGLNSAKARQGALKKATMFLALAFGIFLDYLIPMAAAQIGFEFNTKLLFSSIIAFYICFTECVSICENIFKCNPNAFPKWIVKLLSDGIKHLEDIKHKNNNESEEKADVTD